MFELWDSSDERSYMSRGRMINKIASAVINTPVDLVSACEQFSSAWFRGQGHFDWRLESTLERDARMYSIQRELLYDREEIMLNLFKRSAHLYIGSDEHYPDSVFEWHSLVRHYGGPSRLLDVTSSYLVATYFALMDSKPGQDAALWVFNGIKPNCAKTNLDRMFIKNSRSGITICCPDLMNQRMHAQSGAFIIPHSLCQLLEEQISKEFCVSMSTTIDPIDIKAISGNLDVGIWKLKIPSASHNDLFSFLSRCNVRAYSMFPGIDGLALSLREMLRL